MAIDFVKTSDHYVDCGTSPGSASELSLSCWLTPRQFLEQRPLDKFPLFGTVGWSVVFRSGANIFFRIGSAADNARAIASDVYTAGTRLHVVCTFGSGAAKIYVDGVLAGTTTGITQTPNDVATAFRVGKPSVVSVSNVFDGPIEDVRVYNRVLIANEVMTIYTCRGADGIVHGLVSRWKMLEGYPTQVVSGVGVVKDRSSGYDGTPANSPTWVESMAGRRKRRAA